MMDTLFGGPAPWFTAPALLGTGFLLIQLLMGEIGGDLDADLDDPGSEAKWLSLQTVSAFFVGFGWLGLAALRLFDLGFGSAAVVGLVAGVAVSWLIVRLTDALMGLQSDANLSLAEAVGLEGAVTVIVPPAGGGSGRVTVVVNESQHELPALQDGAEPIRTHARVRVVRADDASGSVTVEAV
jgi:hypothetical protein